MVPGDTGLAIDDVVLVGDVRSMHRLDDGGGGLPREDIDSEDKVADSDLFHWLCGPISHGNHRAAEKTVATTSGTATLALLPVVATIIILSSGAIPTAAKISWPG